MSTSASLTDRDLRALVALLDDARADEARVRVIACGLEAVRAGGGETDRTTLARDADAYLARADARQRTRARALLDAAASR